MYMYHWITMLCTWNTVKSTILLQNIYIKKKRRTQACSNTRIWNMPQSGRRAGAHSCHAFPGAGAQTRIRPGRQRQGRGRLLDHHGHALDCTGAAAAAAVCSPPRHALRCKHCAEPPQPNAETTPLWTSEQYQFLNSRNSPQGMSHLLPFKWFTTSL